MIDYLEREANLDEDLAVILIDLDRLQKVNGALGHSAGDSVLREVASRLTETAPDGSLVAHFAGDSFAVVVRGRPAEDALDIADDLLGRIEGPFSVSGHDFRLGAVAGVAVGNTHRPIASILRDASAALGRAKDADRSHLELATTETRRSALVELDLEYELRRALEGGEMRLHFQPIVRFGTGATVAGEALLRWERIEKDDLLTTERVVSVAEETGLIVPLGDWVIAEALAALRKKHFPCVTVNVSPRQLLDPGFPVRVDRAIRLAGVPARRLALEITEAVSVEDFATTVRHLEELRGVGCRIGLDDFGSGYSSLSYLHRLPVDFLKLDRELVSDVDSSEGAMQVVSSAVALGQALGVATVAEGIERPAQAEALTRMGCRYGQGWLFGRPAPVP